MEYLSVQDPRFSSYGQVLENYELDDLIHCLEMSTPLPENGTVYVPSLHTLEELPVALELQDRGFGGLNIQIGYCNGHNAKLSCLEYHRTSEIDIAATDMILLLARQQEMEHYKLDTKYVRAFFLPRGTAVELYSTTLHYAPCGAKPGRGFRMGCVLPRMTNTRKPNGIPRTQEDQLLWACNKWVIASPGTQEASEGAFVGIIGDPVVLEQEEQKRQYERQLD